MRDHLNLRQPRGSALFAALVMTILGLSLVLAITELSKTNNDASDDTIERDAAMLAAEGAVNLVYSDFIDHYMNVPNMKHLRQDTLNTPPTTGPYFIATTGPGAYYFNLNNGSTKSLNDRFQNRTLGRARITNARIRREDRRTAPTTDSLNGQGVTDLIIEVEVENNEGDGAANDSRRFAWASRRISLTSSPTGDHTEYAVLTKNITCTYCHLKVQDIKKAFPKINPDGTYADAGQYLRLKIGTTDYMALRPGSAASSVEGTIFQRGKFENEQPSNLANAGLTLADLTGSQLKGVEYNSGLRTLHQDASTNSTYQTSFTNAGTDPATGKPYERQNVYMQYPTDPAQIPDGEGVLPTDFPQAFPDANDNRRIDVAELNQVKSLATGTLQGGVCRIVPTGTAYSAFAGGPTSRLPQAGDPGITGANITGSQAGTVVLIGTQADPIRINGDVVIEGDVIIKGYVEGKGNLKVTGNVYAPADIRYKNRLDANGKEVFGEGTTTFVDPADGLTKYKPNLLGLQAGKNIVVGDYLSQVNHWNSGQSKFFQHGKIDPGTKMPNFPLPYTDTQGSGDSGTYGNTTIAGYGNVNGYGKVNFASFVPEELSVFNREELTPNLLRVPTNTGAINNAFKHSTPYITASSNWTGGSSTINPYYNANHVPRYYSMFGARYNTSTSNDTLITKPGILPALQARANLALDDFHPNKNVATITDKWTPYGTGATVAGDTISPNIYLNDKTYFMTQNDALTGKPKGWLPTKDPHTYNAMRAMDELPSAQRGPRHADRVVLNIHPEWITPGDMLNMLLKEEEARPAEPKRIDGLMYTNNAIFAIERIRTQRNSGTWNEATQTYSGGAWSKVNSRSNGKMIVNGAIIAPDLGILVTGGTSSQGSPFNYATPIKNPNLTYELKAFTVNYDPRVKELLRLRDDTKPKWAVYRVAKSSGVGQLPP